MEDLQTKLQKYIKQLEKEAGTCAMNEIELLKISYDGKDKRVITQADILHAKTMVLREVIKDLNTILSDNTH